MAKKKKITQNDITSWYMDYVLNHNKKPSSVYSFAKENNFEENLFYNYYGSFEAIEKGVFKAFFDNTCTLLEKSDEYTDFDPRNKLLSFYYTFFENLTANRSYVVYALAGNKNHLKSLAALTELKKSFSEYIEKLNIQTIDFKEERLEKLQLRSLKETAWLQLLVTIKFWLEDTSASFEKTDIFIEKSVKASFDLIDTTPLKSIIDFGKFLFKEKIHNN
jgi:AcrR family transcriptional regulator